MKTLTPELDLMLAAAAIAPQTVASEADIATAVRRVANDAWLDGPPEPRTLAEVLGLGEFQ